MFRALGYFLSCGTKNIRRNRIMSVTTVGIVAASLAIFGIFMLISININSLLLSIENQCEINVYLSEDTAGATLSQIESDLKKIEGVKDVKFFSKEERLERAKETTYKDKEYMLEDLEDDNPLRDSYILTVENIGMSEQASKMAAEVSGVEEVKNLQELADRIKQFAAAVRRIGGILMIMLAFIAVFIIANTIRLCLVARSGEVSIMRFVGASNGYICGPFLIEGVILGLIGAFTAFLVISWGYITITDKIGAVFAENSVRILSYSEVWHILIGSFAAIGAGIGLAGSGISLRRYLKA